MYIYIYIHYKEREREKERERDASKIWCRIVDVHFMAEMRLKSSV